jgi:hypothetical protein
MYRMQIYMKHNDSWIDHSNATTDIEGLVVECERWRKNHPSLHFRIVTDNPKPVVSIGVEQLNTYPLSVQMEMGMIPYDEKLLKGNK